MFSGDIYMQNSQSLGYKSGDAYAMGWSLKPRYNAGVRTGNWVEETAPLGDAPAAELMSTAHASYRGETPPPAPVGSSTDAHVRSLSEGRNLQGSGTDALYAVASPPPRSTLYGSSFTVPGEQQHTARSFDPKSSRWLPEPVDTLPASVSGTYAQSAKLRWFRQSGEDDVITSTTRASYPAPSPSPSPEKRFARSQQFSRHLMTARSLR